jgi:hypothetical protein
MTFGRVDMHGQVKRPSDEYSAIPAPERLDDADAAARTVSWNRSGNLDPRKTAVTEDAGCRESKSQDHTTEIPAAAEGRTEVRIDRPKLHLISSSWPGITVRRTASLRLAYVPAIHVFLLV